MILEQEQNEEQETGSKPGGRCRGRHLRSSGGGEDERRGEQSRRRKREDAASAGTAGREGSEAAVQCFSPGQWRGVRKINKQTGGVGPGPQ